MKINKRTRVLILCIILTTVILGIYLLGLLMPEHAYAPDFLAAGQAPGIDHIFGTDALGHDLFARTIKGLSVSLSIGIAASLISAVIAVITGIIAASGSKLADNIVTWIIDLVMSVPHALLVILISFALGRGLKGLMIGIAATHWCSLARLVRAEVLQVISQDYIMLSRRLGKSTFWISIHHVLPHLIPQFIVGLILLLPHAILHEAAVSFLGFGLPPEQAAIGIILSESMRSLSAGMWWPVVFPGLMLVLLVLAFDRLGDNLRSIFDPYSAQN